MAVALESAVTLPPPTLLGVRQHEFRQTSVVPSSHVASSREQRTSSIEELIQQLCYSSGASLNLSGLVAHV